MGGKKKTTATAYKINISNNAVLNIDEVTGYIAFVNHQPINAIKIGDAIFDTIERIQKNPYAFKECEEIPTKNKIYRKATCYSWYIIYRIIDIDISILGIIHASRKPSKIKPLRKIKC